MCLEKLQEYLHRRGWDYPYTEEAGGGSIGIIVGSMFFTFADIDFSEQLDYNCPGIKSNKHLASPPGGDYEEVRDFTVGTAHGTVRYKVKSGISFLV